MFQKRWARNNRTNREETEILLSSDFKQRAETALFAVPSAPPSGLGIERTLHSLERGIPTVVFVWEQKRRRRWGEALLLPGFNPQQLKLCQQATRKAIGNEALLIVCLKSIVVFWIVSNQDTRLEVRAQRFRRTDVS